MKKRRTYTNAERSAALTAYEEAGPTQAQKLTGINKGTITRWAKSHSLATVASEKTAKATEAARVNAALKREELRVLLLDKAIDLLKRMDEEHIDFRGKDNEEVKFPKAPAGAVQNYATSAAILIDKLRLELGETTGREAHEVTLQNLSEEDLDAELARLIAAQD